MRGFFRLTAAGLAALSFSACASAPSADLPSISVPYDPYDYDPDDLLAEAQAYCDAYGLDAVYEDETVDPQSVRWRYRHYRCV